MPASFQFRELAKPNANLEALVFTCFCLEAASPDLHHGRSFCITQVFCVIQEIIALQGGHPRASSLTEALRHCIFSSLPLLHETSDLAHLTHHQIPQSPAQLPAHQRCSPGIY